jgi:hypothetical protein
MLRGLVRKIRLIYWKFMEIICLVLVYLKANQPNYQFQSHKEQNRKIATL